MTLQAPKQPLKAGKPLLLRVKVTNTSNHAAGLPYSSGGWGIGIIYQVHVLDDRGQPAPQAPPPEVNGKPVVRGGSIPSRQLRPGGSFTDLVNVTALYDLSRPGKYKIWIAEPYYRGPHTPNGLVRSNAVTVTVVK